MLVIRFFRVGKRNQPCFRIVVTDKRRSSKGGRFTEEVGFWSPLTKEKALKGDRIKYWLSVGAKPSPSIHNLLVEEKIIEDKKIPVHKKSKKEAEKPITAEITKETVLESAPEIKPEVIPEKPQEVPFKAAPEKPIKNKAPEEKPVEETLKTEQQSS